MSYDQIMVFSKMFFEGSFHNVQKHCFIRHPLLSLCFYLLLLSCCWSCDKLHYQAPFIQSLITRGHEHDSCLDSIPSNNHCYYKNEYPIHSSFICQCTWKMEKKLFFLCFCYDFNKFTQACETECNVYTIYAFAIILSCLIFL
jgi:hypothetical protein